jgi:hypothetical protein
MKPLWCGALLAMALSGCGSLIKGPVSRDEFARIHNVGVAAAFDDKFHGRLVGLTVFGNESFDIDVPQWEVSKLAQTRAIEALQQGNPRLHVEAVQVPTLAAIRADDALGWLSTAQQQGLDTVVLLRPSVSGNNQFFVPGVGIYSRMKTTCVYTAYAVEVYDVATRKQIAWEWGANPPCDMTTGYQGARFKSDAARYSEAEKEAMRKLVDARFVQTLPEALKNVHLTGVTE